MLRGQKVMLDSDLAELYEVEVRVLVQAVKRTLDRFPGDFMFQLTHEEQQFLRSQTVTLKKAGRGSSIASTFPMPLPNKAWRCSLVCSRAKEPSW